MHRFRENKSIFHNARKELHTVRSGQGDYLDTVFYPEKVALIGVSRSPGNLAKNILKNLILNEFTGEIYLVGKERGSYLGLKIYHDIADLPGNIDMAAILTPAKTVPYFADECGKKGAASIWIGTGGFDESGATGKKLAASLLSSTRKWGIRFIGPNSLGVINTDNGFCIPFIPLPKMQKGPVSLLSQSGGVGVSYLRELQSENIGLSKFVSLGNKTDVDEVDLIGYLERDPGTRVISLYLESISRGREFLSAIRDASKPVIVHKSNRGHMSRDIALSHTAAMLSDHTTVETSLHQSGAIRVDETRKMMNYAKAFCLPPLKGNRLAVISRSGGHAVVAADACERFEFDLPPFPAETTAAVEKHFRAKIIKLSNPMDLGDLWDIQIYKTVLERVIALPEFDGIIFLFAYITNVDPVIHQDVIQTAIELTGKYNKPIALNFISSREEVSQVTNRFRFPFFGTIDEAVEAMAISRNYYQHRIKPSKIASRPVTGKRKAGMILERSITDRRYPAADESMEILQHYAFSFAPFYTANSLAEIEKAVDSVGFPAAVKFIQPGIIHRSDIGAVRLNISSRRDLVNAVESMRKSFADEKEGEFLIQAMLDGKRELILGAKRDTDFGPVIMVGFGGIYAEIFHDVSSRIAPVSQREAEEMVSELKSFPVLKGYRGMQKAKLRSLYSAITGLSAFMQDFPVVQAVDVNPLIVDGKNGDITAVDAAIILDDYVLS
jgi:acetyltransferase